MTSPADADATPALHAAASRNVRFGWFMAALLAGWSGALAASLAWNLRETRRVAVEFAAIEAQAGFDRDVAYRNWVAEVGGIYVPSTPATPPNPYLAVPGRDIVSPTGEELTLANPAYVTRLMQQSAQKSLHGHLTSTRPLNPQNAPDPWEAGALAQLEKGAVTVRSVEQFRGEPHVRFMGRMLVQEGCLKCHAGQGYRVGDVRGGFSVAVRLAPYLAPAQREARVLIVLHVALWLIGVAGIVGSSRHIRRSVHERMLAEEAMRRAEAEKARLHERLAHAHKLEALGELAGGIAHDFNNLLVPILGLSGMASESLPEAHPARADLDEIQRAGRRAHDLTRRLLAFARKQTLDVRPQDVRGIVMGIEPLLHPLIGEHIKIVLSLAETPIVRADRSQIETVLVNLAANARDAMTAGGQLTISTGQTILGVADSAPLGLRPGIHALIEVADTGCGMDEETLSRAFEPFFTTKPVGKGTGLGLATVHGIVAQHGGSIDSRSSPGRGTTFRVLLPGTEDTLETEPLAEAQPIPRGSETILLAEDDLGVRQFILAALSGLGYRVLVAGDGEEALRMADAHTEPLHLLLSDVVMPGMNGRELLERLTATRPDLRVLFMSGYTRGVLEGDETDGRTLTVLRKPFTAHDLGRAVRLALDDRSDGRAVPRLSNPGKQHAAAT